MQQEDHNLDSFSYFNVIDISNRTKIFLKSCIFLILTQYISCYPARKFMVAILCLATTAPEERISTKYQPYSTAIRTIKNRTLIEQFRKLSLLSWQEQGVDETNKIQMHLNALEKEVLRLSISIRHGIFCNSCCKPELNGYLSRLHLPGTTYICTNVLFELLNGHILKPRPTKSFKS